MRVRSTPGASQEPSSDDTASASPVGPFIDGSNGRYMLQQDSELGVVGAVCLLASSAKILSGLTIY